MSTTVADCVVEALAASGVRRVYGLPGDSLNGFTDALRRNGGIRWNNGWINVSTVCIGEYVGLEEIDDGLWTVYFGPLTLGRLNERLMRIEDHYALLNRRNV